MPQVESCVVVVRTITCSILQCLFISYINCILALLVSFLVDDSLAAQTSSFDADLACHNQSARLFDSILFIPMLQEALGVPEYIRTAPETSSMERLDDICDIGHQIVLQETPLRGWFAT